MKIVKRKIVYLCLLAFIMIFASACNSGTTEETSGETNKDPIKIGVLASQTGALESYGKQTVRGFELGLDYATDGTKEVAGK